MIACVKTVQTVFFFVQLESVLMPSTIPFDIMEDPIKCPLDLSHFAETGHGFKVLLEGNGNAAVMSRFSILLKPVPAIDSFEVKLPISGKKIPLKKFLTPFQRFQVSQF
jgi:hypothetical protein